MSANVDEDSQWSQGLISAVSVDFGSFFWDIKNIIVNFYVHDLSTSSFPSAVFADFSYSRSSSTIFTWLLWGTHSSCWKKITKNIKPGATWRIRIKLVITWSVDMQTCIVVCRMHLHAVVIAENVGTWEVVQKWSDPFGIFTTLIPLIQRLGQHPTCKKNFAINP